MIGNSWDDKLKVIWNSSGFHVFYNKIMKLYEEKTIYPLKENIFNAFKLTPYENVALKTVKSYIDDKNIHIECAAKDDIGNLIEIW